MVIIMKITSVKGTNDYLPNEVEIRDYLINKILDVYKINGFEHIMTPAVEDIENLNKSDGGENLNLIFKILKRGDKLNKALCSGNITDENMLVDMGLRYDLTLPLSRYYANNKEKLTLPMKCIQIDRVYRAERPQKGRLREFVQCDIDILGSKSADCEVELILITTKALAAIVMKNFKVNVNDRQILRAVLLSFGFKENELDSVCITFDKMDKIGTEGVMQELKDKGFDEKIIEVFISFLQKGDFTLEAVSGLLEELSPVENIKSIINAVKELSDIDFDIVFDLTLVRGQGYYTGTVFEVESVDFKGSIAGGGRYDNLIGKFLNESVPAVGFSIGFERIFSIFMSSNLSIPERPKKIAVVYDEGNVIQAIKEADKLREAGNIASIYVKPKKLGKLLNHLEQHQYDGFLNVGVSDEVKMFQEQQ